MTDANSMEIIARKRACQRDLAPCAIDVGLTCLQDCGYPAATGLHVLAHAVVDGARGADDPGALAWAFDHLAGPDRDALSRFLVETSLLPDTAMPLDAVRELDTARSLHWPRAFGFALAADARSEPGDDASDALPYRNLPPCFEPAEEAF